MRRVKRVLVITGVPGTGKTSLSNRLAKRIGNVQVVHTTELVSSRHLFSGVSKSGEKIVTMGKLKLELERIITKSTARVLVLEGHLLCDIGISGAAVLVLREHLPVLAARLKRRGYGKEKIAGNITDEALDYCGIHAANHYAVVFEAFTADRQLVPKIEKLLEGQRLHSSIDLMPELYKMISLGSIGL